MELYIINTPISLTLFRLIVSPCILPALIICIVPYNFIVCNALLALFFVGLGLTDFFDGYLARKYHQETLLGKILDPIADKFLLFSTLIALLVIHKIFYYWAILFIGREFFVMGLRMLALEHGFDIPVHPLGKIKTVMQICYSTLAIFNGTLIQWMPLLNLEKGIMFIALLLSLISCLLYYREFMKKIREKLNNNECIL